MVDEKQSQRFTKFGPRVRSMLFSERYSTGVVYHLTYGCGDVNNHFNFACSRSNEILSLRQFQYLQPSVQLVKSEEVVIFLVHLDFGFFHDFYSDSNLNSNFCSILYFLSIECS